MKETISTATKRSLRIGILILSVCFLRLADASPTFASDVYCGCSVDVQDFGGPTMTGTTDVYAIWYGYWPESAATIATVDGFLSHLNGSDYMNIATTYGVSNEIDFKGSYFADSNDTAPQRYIRDGTLHDLIDSVTAPGSGSGIPAESNAIYFIFTAPNVFNDDGAFDCGYHSDDGGLKYAWIGSIFGAGCGGVTAADGLTVSASHELFETLTDPLYSEPGGLAWYDGGPNDQGEIADICYDGIGQQTSLNGFAAYVNPIFVRDPNYVSTSLLQPGGYCASGNPRATASSVPEPTSWLLMTAGLAVMARGVARRRVAVR